jgi:hypothetical protein
MTTSSNAGRTAKKPEAAAQPSLQKVMVALSGINEVARIDGTRAEKIGAMKAAAKQGRDRVVHWLGEQDVRGEYKRVSQPTSFGTFTMECTPRVTELVRRGPGVESAERVADLPLEALRGKR